MQDRSELKGDKAWKIAKVGALIVVVGGVLSIASGTVNFVKQSDERTLIDDFKSTTYYSQEIDRQQNENLQSYSDGEINYEEYQQNSQDILSDDNAVEILKSSESALKLEYNHIEDLQNTMFTAMISGLGVVIAGATVVYAAGGKAVFDLNEEIKEI